MPKILVGTDPEVFLRNKSTSEFVSAHGMFPGDKTNPFPLENGAMQVDGHALEFNTNPVDNEDEFVYTVTSVFNQVKSIVNEVDPNLEIVLEPVATFNDKYFSELPEESKELGCSPDFSSLTGEVLSAPDISHVPLRTSSGHIHIGWTNMEDPFATQNFRKRLELASKITPYLLRVAEGWETPNSTIRRTYYGREGAFRPKHYGVELRALDCLWLASEDSMRKVFRTTVEAFEREYNAL